jgi:uncharacterized protein with GYD domain
MPTFILLTRLSPQALHQPRSFETLERHVAQQVLDHCPTLTWLSSHALLGPWDYLDVIEAPDMETMTRASLLVRSYGKAQTEVWPAMAWPEFKAMLQGLSGQT